MKRVVVASRNAGKLDEISRILKPLGWTLDKLPDAMPETEETGASFVENALIKARAASAYTGHMSLADDSGLVVPALGGRPGIHSARFSGSHADDPANIRLLLESMRHLSGVQRKAYFCSTVAWVRFAQDPDPLICQSRWYGWIMESSQGHDGFGYDPVFRAHETDCSAAQLPDSEKDRLSHRGKALRHLNEVLIQMEDDYFA